MTMEGKSTVTVECPHCQKKFLAQKMDQPGKYKTTCPHCKKPILLNNLPQADVSTPKFDKQTIKTVDSSIGLEPAKTGSTYVWDDDSTIKPLSKGELVWWGKFFIPKHYKLKEGSNIVGRAIPGDDKTDLALDDPFVSAHSVDIKMLTDPLRGTRYLLQVLRNRNPVLLNGNNVQGEEYLQFGDTIKLGKTTLKLKQAKWNKKS